VTLAFIGPPPPRQLRVASPLPSTFLVPRPPPAIFPRRVRAPAGEPRIADAPCGFPINRERQTEMHFGCIRGAVRLEGDPAASSIGLCVGIEVTIRRSAADQSQRGRRRSHWLNLDRVASQSRFLMICWTDGERLGGFERLSRSYDRDGLATRRTNRRCWLLKARTLFNDAYDAMMGYRNPIKIARSTEQQHSWPS